MTHHSSLSAASITGFSSSGFTVPSKKKNGRAPHSRKTVFAAAGMFFSVTRMVAPIFLKAMLLRYAEEVGSPTVPKRNAPGAKFHWSLVYLREVPSSSMPVVGVIAYNAFSGTSPSNSPTATLPLATVFSVRVVPSQRPIFVPESQVRPPSIVALIPEAAAPSNTMSGNTIISPRFTIPPVTILPLWLITGSASRSFLPYSWSKSFSRKNFTLKSLPSFHSPGRIGA